ncbi:hypothetical protein PA7_09320 [Pseudonocardia asaccharolytica DSM 44247 = NBRC 16224]|uniref:DUF3040 domain-containing protein n=2 Tax=Pseudonocardia asaccharolytica TaxID=54010 RepID=A0A511CX09_9PSEU|nr:hypothetical protein PA7_09320 [Pseudonocardia asaccharolytica DSM 44247 = NBRC 16224]
MLSRWERQSLQEIEQHLQAEDPRLAVMLERAKSARTRRWLRRGYDAVVVLAVLLAGLCLALGEVGSGFAAGAVAVLVFHWRRRRFPLRRRWAWPSDTRPVPGSDESFP